MKRTYVDPQGQPLDRESRDSPAEFGEIDACLDIARDLPEYFNAAGLAAMASELHQDELWVAIADGAIVGFAAVRRKSSPVAEVSWMAVRKGRQHRGIGSRLLDRMFADLAASGVALLEVKTLADRVDYPPYEATRRFYRRAGFVEVEVVDPYPAWGPGNPCAIYVRVLGSTGGKPVP